MKNEIPKSVLASYDIGNVRSIKGITDGLVHKTFKLKTQKGTFILQQLHPLLAHEAIAEDFLSVTRYLESQKFLTARAVLSRSGDMLVKESTRVWRMQTYVPGKIYHRLSQPTLAREAGSLFAKFHRTLAPIAYSFQTPLVWFQTRRYYETLLSTLKSFEHSALLEGVQEEASFLQKHLPKQFMPQRLRTRVIHADPKISNFIFNSKGKAVAIIDLDLVQRGYLPLDLGDAFRSWCGREEDDPRNCFNLNLFRAAFIGYQREAKGFITKQELQLIPRGIGAVLLELSARFLIDYFQDTYFGWDSSRYESRRDHNLARCRGQIAEFKDLQKKLPAIKKIMGLS
ncbi:phosphotransferase [Candidatus Uhrbacteria bacterium]|nr:phosphotransferase [Candidatus Uhrbacteria bacterium]